MRKYRMLAAVAGLAVSGSFARGDFQFNLIKTSIPASSSLFANDDQWTVQVLNNGANGTGTNLLALSVTMMALNSNGTANTGGTFFIRSWNSSAGFYDTVTPANNTSADFLNQGTTTNSGTRPGPAGSFVSTGASFVGVGIPSQTSQTFSDGQAIGYNATLANTAPQAAGLGGNFTVVGLPNSVTGITDTSFTTIAQAVVPKGETPAFDLGLSGTTGNPTYKLLLGLPGDANFDDSVNGADLSILLAHYNTTTGNTWSTGDFNGDGAVNGADLSILLANYNNSITPAALAATASLGPAVSAVPEPASLGLLGLAAGALMLRRRRA